MNCVLLLCITFSQGYQILSPSQATTTFDSSSIYNTNEKPVIGLVCQPLEDDMVEPIYDGYRTYVMAAYVKYLEAAGARVVPMMTTEDEATTLDKLSKVNGVLFPGGGGGTNYTDYGRIIYNKAKEYNDQGNFFPMFGICLGMQNMAIWASTEGTSVLDNIAAHNISLPLTFEIPPEQTKMFSGLGDEAWNFAKYNITMNSHSQGVDPAKFASDGGLSQIFYPTSVSYEPEGEHNPFVASMESYRYPFYGTQFHPAKTITMYNDDSGTNHTWGSDLLNRSLVDFFMSDARQNSNPAGDFKTVQAAIIQNDKLLVTPSYYGEVYVFP